MWLWAGPESGIAVGWKWSQTKKKKGNSTLGRPLPLCLFFCVKCGAGVSVTRVLFGAEMVHWDCSVKAEVDFQNKIKFYQKFSNHKKSTLSPFPRGWLLHFVPWLRKKGIWAPFLSVSSTPPPSLSNLYSGAKKKECSPPQGWGLDTRGA